MRVRPSQGDGGVDIFVPGPDGFVKQRSVHQFKKYSATMTGGRRPRSPSRTTVVAVSKKEGREITEWHLVMPLGLTDRNLANWSRELTADAEFPCEINGLMYHEANAAKYRKIVDYYVRDSKERLQAAMDSLTVLIAGR